VYRQHLRLCSNATRKEVKSLFLELRMNPKVDAFIRNANHWPKELEALRQLVLDCGLTEELKWKQACYTFQQTNMLIISELKDYCVLSFLKGVLLADTEKLLVQPGENSQSVRFMKFTSVKQIVELEATIKAYVFEAIEVEKSGIKVELVASKNVELVAELVAVLDKDKSLKSAFEALTPGRQRGYNMFFGAAKQAKTRLSRIATYTNRILKGKGMNDCVCGHSKRMPNCDGSHKYL
jgi:uncharacterized protein YdeI (YjbR/CyaY-like superfamily)